MCAPRELFPPTLGRPWSLNAPKHARACACGWKQFYLGNYQQAINEASTKKLVNKDLTQERDIFLLRSYLAQKKVRHAAYVGARV